MKMAFSPLLLIFILLLQPMVHAQKKPPLLLENKTLPRKPMNAEEKTVITDLNSGPYDKAKTLINPPVGKLSSEVKKTEAYFNSIMKKLLDSKPFDGEVKVKINFYAEDEFSIYSKSMSEDEKIWFNSRSKINREWPMRRFLDVKNKATPIYEIGVSTEFLKKIQSEDELAFFMAKELDAIRESLYNPDFKKNERLAKQVERTASDVDAVEWMKKAGYSPEASVSALDLIYLNQDPHQKVYPVLDALKGDAHEGVRYGVVQAQIEHLKRSSVTSLKTELTPLPESITLTKQPRSRRKLTAEQFQELRSEVLKVVENDFMTTQPSQYFLHEHNGSKSSKSPYYKMIRMYLRPTSSEQVGTLFKESVELIAKSSKSKQMKGNAILRLFDFFNPSKMGQPPPPLYLSDDDVISVVKKLREFSIGPDAWNSDESLRLMQLDMGDSLPEWHFNRLSSFADDQTYQKIFSKLYQVDPEYRKFLKKLPEFSMLSARTGESKARKLILHLDFIDYYKGNFQPIAMKNAVEQLNAYPLIEEAKTVSGFDLYDELDAQIKDTKNEEIKKLLTPFKDKVKDAFLPEYEKRLNAFFNSPLKSVNVAFDELNEMSEIMKKMDLSHETLNNASNYVFKFAKEMIQNSKLIPEGRITNQLEIWDGPLSKLFSDALKNPARSKEDKKMLLDFILGNKEPKVGLRLSKPGTVELVKSMQEVVGGMTPAEVQAWVGRDLRAQYRDELTQLLSEAQKYPQMKKNDAGLRDLVKALDEDRAGSMAGTVYKDFQTTKVQFKMREMMELMQKYDSKIDYMVNTPIQRNINILSVMGADGEFSKRMAKKYSFAEFQKLLKILENQKKRAVLISEAAQGYVNSGAEQLLVADNKGGTFLLDLFDHVNGDAPSLDAWYETYLKVKKLSPVGVRENWQTSDRLGEILSERLKKLSSAEIKVWLKKEGVMDLIPEEKMVPLLRQVMSSELIAEGSGSVKNRALLANEVSALNAEYELQKKYPQAFVSLKEDLAAEFLIQPGETDVVFKDLTKTTGQNVRIASGETRALSGLVSLSRKQSVQDQIDLIEYLMGRKEAPPAFVFTAANDVEKISSMPEYLREMRMKLMNQTELERALVTNTFLAGPHSFMETEKGLNEMVDYLLKDVSSKNKEVAHELAQALIRAEGRNRSLGVSYVLGQKVVEDGSKLAESRILKSLFEAYGVPGIKLGQYLAFTSELKDFRAVLEELQDSAMPLKYLDAVKLCEERFGPDWPSKIEITGMKGSGSVNVALTYKELDTGKTGVFSILRSNIENSTKHDFFRFQNFIQELTKTPEGAKKYGYLAGLSDVIENSVALEFDKVGSMKMQQYVKPMYNETVNGWNVRTIDAYSEKNKAIFMQEAPGKGARKILAKDPETYKSALKALSQVEMDRLLGIGPDGKAKPIPLYANPDFHNGQVLIDVPNHQVTLLDFGQAVKISNQERELGVDILRIISKAETPEKAAKILNTGLLAKTGKTISVLELSEILKRTDRMDIFIKLLSTLGQKKMNVPLSTVHWVLAANRQIALGEIIGVNNMKTFRNIVIADKIGMGPRTYNWLRLGRRKLCDFSSTLQSLFKK